MKVLLFGAGENAKKFLSCNPVTKKIEIVGIIDNNEMSWGKTIGEKYIIAAPKEIETCNWDKIIVTPNNCNEIINQLENEYGVDKEKILKIGDLIVPSESNLGSISLCCEQNLANSARFLARFLLGSSSRNLEPKYSCYQSQVLLSLLLLLAFHSLEVYQMLQCARQCMPHLHLLPPLLLS